MVRSIVAVEPSDTDTDGERDPLRRWFEVEVNVTPKPGDGPFQGWEPGELRLVDFRAKPPSADDDPDDAAACESRVVETRDGGEWEPYEGDKYAGPRTVLLRLGVPPGLSKLKFRYSFEDLGPLTLPEAPATPEFVTLALLVS